MTKAYNNNQPCGFQPDSNETTVEEPQEDTVVDLSFQRLVGNEEELVRLELQLTDDRNKKVRADVFVKGLKTKLEVCKAKLEASKASRIAASKKHKGEIEGLKIKEKSALDAASTSSKLVDDATKEVLGSKAEKIREMRKQISDLTTEAKDGRTLRLKFHRLKSDIEILNKEKSALFQDNSSL
jgi:hypothetical protein